MKSNKAAKVAPRGLGKGLSALMSESYSQTVNADSIGESADNSAAPSSGQATLKLDQIQSGKYQPRLHFDETALRELTDSVRKNGVMQPILVRPLESGGHEIIAGERRWRAAKEAGLDSIPVFIRELSDAQALELSLIENIQRKDLNPLEEAAGYQRLMEEFSYTQEALSGIVHKSRSHIANLLRLLSLPAEIQEMLRNDSISMGHARALLGADQPLELAKAIVAQGLSVREAEKRARGDIAPRPQNPVGIPRPPRAARPEAEGTKDPDILALEETLSENLGLKVSISDRGQSGEITVSYASLEQLDEILQRLGGSI